MIAGLRPQDIKIVRATSTSNCIQNTGRPWHIDLSQGRAER
jgi:hypothetical protein